MFSEFKLEIAQRHVREGERHVVQQRALVLELAGGGHSTLDAEDLLRVFEMTLSSHREQLAVVQLSK